MLEHGDGHQRAVGAMPSGGPYARREPIAPGAVHPEPTIEFCSSDWSAKRTIIVRPVEHGDVAVFAVQVPRESAPPMLTRPDQARHRARSRDDLGDGSVRPCASTWSSIHFRNAARRSKWCKRPSVARCASAVQPFFS